MTFCPLDGNSRAYGAKHYGLSAPSGTCSGEEHDSFIKAFKAKVAEKSPNLSFPEISYRAWASNDSAGVATSSDGTAAVPKADSASPKPFLEKNVILYGTPGTGKTYSTAQYAVAIIEEKPLSDIMHENYDAVFARYLRYKEDGLVAFTTFHQSFGYEEFIEGIRPVVSSEDKTETVRDIEYEVRDGVFKAFCDKAGAPVRSDADLDLGIGKNPSVWKVSLEGTGDNPTRAECMEKGHIRIGWDNYGPTISDSTDYGSDGGRTVLNTFYNRMQIGDIVFSCYSSKTIDAVGVIVGEPEWHDEYDFYKRLRPIKWLAKGLNEDITDLNAGKSMTLSSVYKLSVSVSDALETLRKVRPELFTQRLIIPNRVFIIDEINRGNISKIFGELITLIEPSKRIGAKEQLRAILPYSGQNFGVPNNVYIIGTMNAADRSIALVDVALRRRFRFDEILPDSSVLANVIVGNGDNVVDVAEMLKTLNKRITVLLDREHAIGHSYLLPLKEDPTLERLADIFKGKIVPLLQECFYDDYEKIQLVLGDNQKADDGARFVVKKSDAHKLFGNADIDLPVYYEINDEAFMRIDAYAFLR
jgi:5-methylcytosine-specific restriction protein B